MATFLLPDLETPRQRRRFVRLFLTRLSADQTLNPAFHGPHSPQRPTAQEYAWWERALTGTRYHGRPTPAFTQPQLLAPQFSNWCQHLKKTFTSHFCGPGATAAQGQVLDFATMLAHARLRQPVPAPKLTTHPKSAAWLVA